jgi:hypothetical protein
MDQGKEAEFPPLIGDSHSRISKAATDFTDFHGLISVKSVASFFTSSSGIVVTVAEGGEDSGAC